MRSTLLFCRFLAVLPLISAAPQGKFIETVTLHNRHVFSLSGCHLLKTLNSEVDPSKGRDKLSVETCMASCDAHNFKYGGVGGDDQCLCDNDFQGNLVGLGDCQANTCVGDRGEYCGSATTLILYKRTSISG